MRERQAWIVVTAVLSTALAWLAALSLALVWSAYVERAPELVVVMRALGHALLQVGRIGAPAAGAAGVASALLLAAALPHRAGVARSERHG